MFFRGWTLLFAASILIVLACAQSGFREAEIDTIRTRTIESRERIMSIDSRLLSLEALKIDARLTRTEDMAEGLQYWGRGIGLGMALLLIEAFGRFIMTKKKDN